MEVVPTVGSSSEALESFLGQCGKQPPNCLCERQEDGGIYPLTPSQVGCKFHNINFPTLSECTCTRAL